MRQLITFTLVVFMTSIGFAATSTSVKRSKSKSTTVQSLNSETRAKALNFETLKNRYFSKKHSVIPVVGVTSFSLLTKGPDTSNESGYSLGVIVEDKISDDSYLQYGIQYFQANSSSKATFGNVETELQMEYLGLPVYLTKDMGSTTQSTMFVKGGAMLAYLHSAEVFEGNERDSVLTKFKRTDILPTVGVGYKIRQSGKATLNLEANYMRGIVDIARGSGSNRKAYNEGYGLNASLLF